MDLKKYMLVKDATPTESRWEKVIENYLGIEIPDQKKNTSDVFCTDVGNSEIYQTGIGINQKYFAFLSYDGRRSLSLFANGKVVQRECHDAMGVCDLNEEVSMEGRVDPLKASLILAALGVPDIVIDPVNASVIAELHRLQDELREAQKKDAQESASMKLY